MHSESSDIYHFMKQLGDIGYGMHVYANDDTILIKKDTWVADESVTDRICIDAPEAIAAARAILKHFNVGVE